MYAESSSLISTLARGVIMATGASELSESSVPSATSVLDKFKLALTPGFTA